MDRGENTKKMKPPPSCESNPVDPGLINPMGSWLFNWGGPIFGRFFHFWGLFPLMVAIGVY